MSSIADFIKGQIETVREILNLFIELVTIIGKNKALVITLLILLLSYFGLKYYAFEIPQTRLEEFHSAIDDQKYEKAWGMLSKRYKVKYYKDNIRNFMNETNPNGMGRYFDIQITNDYDSNNPFSVLFKDNLMFTISTVRKNIVSLDDLKNSGNSYHRFRTSLWLQLSYNRYLDELKKGNFGTHLEYETVLKRRFILIKEDGNWVIDDSPKIYEGYKYKNYLDEG